MQVKRKLGVAMTAMSIAAVAGGIGAAGAQAQNEVLQGTATTTSGGVSFGTPGSCGSSGSHTVWAVFSAAGTATGPYTGQFTNTNATGSVSGYQKPGQMFLRLHIPFTISSGTTTITGTINPPNPDTLPGWFLCNGSTFTGFEAATGNWLNYTATIQTLGQPAQTISGTAAVDGNFYIQPGAQTAVTETLALP